MIKLLGIIALIILIVVFGPLATLWAFNTLFPAVNIPYTFWTWLATLVLGFFFRGSAKVSD